mgnify:CR=1 FL=1
MSADNAVYILVTKGSRGKREYRVSHEQAIENLWYEPDHPQGSRDGINTEYAHLLFGKSRVFTDMKLAQGYAERMFDEVMSDFGVVEYGIATLDFSRVRFPRMPEESQGELRPDDDPLNW